jgi:dihydroneopterin aldolase
VRDTVSIRDLSVSAVIGVYDWEREIEQTLVFDIDMAADVARAAATDAIEDALDYSAVAGTVRAVVTEGKFQLIETAAERVAARLLADYRLGWVRVSVVKPLPGEGYTAAITIERDAVLPAALPAVLSTADGRREDCRLVSAAGTDTGLQAGCTRAVRSRRGHAGRGVSGSVTGG